MANAVSYLSDSNNNDNSQASDSSFESCELKKNELCFRWRDRLSKFSVARIRVCRVDYATARVALIHRKNAKPRTEFAFCSDLQALNDAWNIAEAGALTFTCNNRLVTTASNRSIHQSADRLL